MFKKLLKNQKGLTLIELLVVVVILGIIAAIAVPSVGGMIDNSKKDAHVANAQQMINSARLMVASEGFENLDNNPILLEDLVAGGYIEPLDDPDKTNDGYDGTGSFVLVGETNNVYTYTVTLTNGQDARSITSKTQDDLNRSDAFK